MTVLDSNLKITEVDFELENDQITTDSAGIHTAYSKIEIVDSNFKGPSFGYLYERIYSLNIEDMNGAFIAAYQYSNLTITDTTFKGGRGNMGGCILLLGLSEAKIKGASFDLCAAMFGGAIYADGHRFLEIESSTFKKNIAY